jgi:TetR/AcrR family transcriptional regulator
VDAYFAFLRTHPEFVCLLLWENLQEGRHLALLGRSVNKSPMLRHLEIILAKGVKEGIFRPNLDGRKVLISLIGLCLVYFSNRHTLSLTVGLDLSSSRVLKQAAEHTSTLLLGGLRA